MATKTRELADFILEEGIGGDADIAIQSKPHIIPGVLYPAVAGKLLDGSTSHGATYGVAQGDGRSYYYTDIKGSKPIKDPRIGAHFGSQRHGFSSLQLLEQETATHGKEVHSVDGREWLRVVEGTLKWYIENTSNGISLNVDDNATGMFLEITGYFNDINLLGTTSTDRANNVDITVNGDSASRVDGATTFDTTVASPLRTRFVSSSSVINLGGKTALGSSTLKAELGTTPAINTVKIEYMASGFYDRLSGIELIAQDTSNVNNIQIPSQNVVSYGKKFTVSGTPHYNPFAFAGDGTTAVAIGDTTSHGKVATGWTGATSAYFDSTLDTATSLGLSAWETGGDFYRPVNGGRVVRWVDSSGTIKTSVNMMPPCATAITAGSDASLPTSHAWTTVYQPKIKSGSIDHSQSEVAKTFHWREFGNGSANGGTGATYADASMLNTGADDIAYVMDDGLTSLSGNDVKEAGTMLYRTANASYHYITFIGTGVSKAGGQSGTAASEATIAQNLPYGTHILKHSLNGSSTTHADITIDGVVVSTNIVNDHLSLQEITFHQPKMPPIPDDAVVISDYMLMADFVPRSDSSANIGLISKGVRRSNMSRDWFFENTSGNGLSLALSVTESSSGFSAGFGQGSGNQYKSQLPSFCTNFVATGYSVSTRCNLFIDNVDTAPTAIGGGNGSYGRLTSNVTLGLHTVRTSEFASGYNTAYDFDLATPIHTSSHYQTFETPFLHELVGGDRNMEQTNLVVTPDGKTWDEVTRDVGYIGNIVVLFRGDPGASNDTDNTQDTLTYFEDKRGTHNVLECHQKDWALAYDRMICLKAGQYRVRYDTSDQNSGDAKIYINGAQAMTTLTTSTRSHAAVVVMHNFQRGDNVQIEGAVQGGYYMQFVIEKIGRS